MTALEERLRAATRAAAEQITAAGLAPPPPRRRLKTAARGTGRRFRRPPPWFAPVAAAAAVLAVVAGSFIVSRTVLGQQRTSPASAAAAPGVPPYYVALASYSSSLGVAGAGDVVVRATATGRVLARVAPPAGEAFTAVTAAADDRTFVLAAETTAELAHRIHPESGLFAPSTRFFLLHFDAGRDKALLTPLAVPALPGVSWFALSPDGFRLAVALTSRDTLAVQVYSLGYFSLSDPGGRLASAPVAPRTWRVSSSYQKHQHRFAETISLSWAGNQALAYRIGPISLQGPGFPLGLLNTATAGGSLIKDSAMYLRSAPGCSSGIITADGRREVNVTQAGNWWVRVDCTLSPGQVTVTGTGSPVWYAGGNGVVEDLLWASPTGHVLIVAGSSGRLNSNVVGVLNGSRFTSLPGSSEIPFVSPFPGAAVAW